VEPVRERYEIMGIELELDTVEERIDCGNRTGNVEVELKPDTTVE